MVSEIMKPNEHFKVKNGHEDDMKLRMWIVLEVKPFINFQQLI
jgi:hypothetical protein